MLISCWNWEGEELCKGTGLSGLKGFKFLGRLANVGGGEERCGEVGTEERVSTSALSQQAELAGAGGREEELAPASKPAGLFLLSLISSQTLSLLLPLTRGQKSTKWRK